MEFGKLLLSEALGCILAHRTSVPGQVFQKGTVLDAAAVRKLKDAGYIQVTAARLTQHEVAENEAARRISDALLDSAGIQGVLAGHPATGRVNLTAAYAGLFRADRLLIDTLNALHEGITVATLADATPVASNDMVATIKIIPFAVPAATLAEAEAVAGTVAALRVARFRPLRTALVMTELPNMKDSLLSNTLRVTKGRIERLGGTLLRPLRVPHATNPVAEAIADLLPDADLLLIAGASAVMDRHDVGPSAIVAAGGSIDHFGMPVDPGNLICVGHIGSLPALVLPGCARSPALNGIDFLLSRIFASEPIGTKEINAMGVGGLLKDFVGRPIPRLRMKLQAET